MCPSASPANAATYSARRNFLAQLRGDQSADNRASRPSGFEIAQTACAGVKNIASERHEHHVGADHSGHQDGMRDSQGAHQRLLLEVLKTFAQVGVHGE